jgi:hypothetical protein
MFESAKPEPEKAEKKKLDLNRREMPKQSAEARTQNFDEVALGYTAELAIEEARRCLARSKSTSPVSSNAWQRAILPMASGS